MGKGHTKIPNYILDTLTHIKLSGSEWNVLMLIIRKTLGWHKNDDWISLTQFVRICGIDKSSVRRALQTLEERKIVCKSAHSRKGSKYELNKNCEEWTTQKNDKNQEIVGKIALRW